MILNVLQRFRRRARSTSNEPSTSGSYYNSLQMDGEAGASIPEWDSEPSVLDGSCSRPKELRVNHNNLLGVERLLEHCQKREVLQDKVNDTNIVNIEGNECCVCMEREATIRALPCTHRVCCRTCAAGVLKTAIANCSKVTCVVCRAPVHRFLKESAPVKIKCKASPFNTPMSPSDAIRSNSTPCALSMSSSDSSTKTSSSSDSGQSSSREHSLS